MFPAAGSTFVYIDRFVAVTKAETRLQRDGSGLNKTQRATCPSSVAIPKRPKQVPYSALMLLGSTGLTTFPSLA